MWCHLKSFLRYWTSVQQQFDCNGLTLGQPLRSVPVFGFNTKTVEVCIRAKEFQCIHWMRPRKWGTTVHIEFTHSQIKYFVTPKTPVCTLWLMTDMCSTVIQCSSSLFSQCCSVVTITSIRSRDHIWRGEHPAALIAPSLATK